jgi:predicted transcriptional regulator
MSKILRQDWFRRKIEEGLNTADVGELTRERISSLVQKGMEAARKCDRLPR